MKESKAVKNTVLFLELFRRFGVIVKSQMLWQLFVMPSCISFCGVLFEMEICMFLFCNNIGLLCLVAGTYFTFFATVNNCIALDGNSECICMLTG